MRLLVLLSIIFYSCNTSKTSLHNSAHEKYKERLRNAELERSPFVQTWLAAAIDASVKPVKVSLPYKESGYFPADKPMASGLQFSAKRGQQLTISIDVTPVRKVLWFLDVWHLTDKLNHIAATDSSERITRIEIEKDGEYVIRFQPELMVGLGYTLTIVPEASLTFPVKKEDKPAIISFWGVNRDGGKRKHEGIDIAAKKRTPVVAGANGRITSVSQNNLGGKVVFMRPAQKNISLYYAHLDEQLVQSGQSVKAGDVIGLIGNTGNAVTTVPHLHFGIYTSGGAVDPLPFVDPEKKLPPPVTADTGLFNNYVRLSVKWKNQYGKELPENTLARIHSATSSEYKVAFPDGSISHIRSSLVTPKPSGKYRLKENIILYDQPSGNAAVIASLVAGSELLITGKFNGWKYVRSGDLTGWVK